MGIVQKQKKEIENLRKKEEGLERKIEKMKEISNSRARRALEEEAKLESAIKIIEILIHRLGGEVEIEEQEWEKNKGIIICRQDLKKRVRVLKLI